MPREARKAEKETRKAAKRTEKVTRKNEKRVKKDSKLYNHLLEAVEQSPKDVDKTVKRFIKQGHSVNYELTYHGRKTTPLSLAVDNGSLEAFKILLRNGADPFFKPTPNSPSVMEKMARDIELGIFNPDKKNNIFLDFLMKDPESPILNWSNLKEHKDLHDYFVIHNLMPNSADTTELPIHKAIQTGNIDLMKQIVRAVGDIQHAGGNIKRTNILEMAIDAACKGKDQNMEMLKYILSQPDVNLQTANDLGNPPILQSIVSSLFDQNINEKNILEVVKLLHENGASLSASGGNDNTPLTAAIRIGHNQVFEYLINHADANNLNQKVGAAPYYVAFQLFGGFNSTANNKLSFDKDELLNLMSNLQSRGMNFNQIIDIADLVTPSPFGENYIRATKDSIQNANLLHYCIGNMTDPIPKMDLTDSVEVIQALINNGVDPNQKATFTRTVERYDDHTRQTIKEVQEKELTPLEYLKTLQTDILKKYGNNPSKQRLLACETPEAFKRELDIEFKKAPTNEKEQMFNQWLAFHNLQRVLDNKPIVKIEFKDLGRVKKDPGVEKDAQSTPVPPPPPKVTPSIPKTEAAPRPTESVSHQFTQTHQIASKNVSGIRKFISKITEKVKDMFRSFKNIFRSSQPTAEKGEDMKHDDRRPPTSMP